MPKERGAFQVLKILHLAMLTGITLLVVVILIRLKISRNTFIDESFERALQIVAVVISLGSLLIGFNLFRRKIMQLRNSSGTAEQRMEQYRAACVQWWALNEGPGLLASIGLLLSGNYAFLALAVFHIAILAVFMPRKENIIMLLNLNSDEVARLEQGERS